MRQVYINQTQWKEGECIEGSEEVSVKEDEARERKDNGSYRVESRE
jgi:hypothetical protein